MADVKWIKLKVGMFDGMSFKKIKRAKIGGESFRDKLTAVWFELMDFAGKCNHNGAFIDSREIPFKELSDIAMMIDREEEELELCMAFFIKEGMVSIEDDVYMLSAWSAYQNTEGLDKIREQNRKRVAKHREKQKALECNVTGNVTVTECNATDKEEEKEREKDEIRVVECSKAHNNSDNFSKSAKKCGKLEKLQGSLGKGVVFLTDEQFDNLLDELGIDAFDRYVERLADFIIEKDAKIKNHYETILKWHREDSAV